MAISSTLDEATASVTLRHPDRGEITFKPDDPADLAGFLDWVRPLNPPDRAQPVEIVKAGRGMTDSQFPSVSILSLESLRDLSGKMGQDLSVDRWRGNIWLKSGTAFTEFDWIGKHLRIGGTVLRIEERITRCVATSVDPQTGRTDADTLAGLQTAYGHRDFGVYGVVVEGGTISIGNDWSVS